MIWPVTNSSRGDLCLKCLNIAPICCCAPILITMVTCIIAGSKQLGRRLASGVPKPEIISLSGLCAPLAPLLAVRRSPTHAVHRCQESIRNLLWTWTVGTLACLCVLLLLLLQVVCFWDLFCVYIYLGAGCLASSSSQPRCA